MKDSDFDRLLDRVLRGELDTTKSVPRSPRKPTGEKPWYMYDPIERVPTATYHTFATKAEGEAFRKRQVREIERLARENFDFPYYQQELEKYQRAVIRRD